MWTTILLLQAISAAFVVDSTISVLFPTEVPTVPYESDASSCSTVNFTQYLETLKISQTGALMTALSSYANPLIDEFVQKS